LLVLLILWGFFIVCSQVGNGRIQLRLHSEESKSLRPKVSRNTEKKPNRKGSKTFGAFTCEVQKRTVQKPYFGAK